MVDDSPFNSISEWSDDNFLDQENEETDSYFQFMTTNSSASSECGDEYSIDLGVSERIFTWSDLDSLDTTLNLDPSLSDWVNEVTCPITTSETVTVLECPPRNNEMFSSCLNPFEIDNWSELSSYEQMKVVQEITHIISTQMGLREQIDVIRIIDPKARVSSSDKEFVIDLNCLNDEKWRKVKASVLKNSTAKRKTSRNTKTAKSRNNNNNNNNTTSTTTTKNLKRQIREQELQMKAEEKKRLKQHRKEKRSGLFRKEEVLSLSASGNLPEEEEIDILD